MIPKIIHYCWFGKNPLPESAKKCIDSWKKYCPEYEIIEWNEENFDIHINMYTEQAYLAKKWAFVSDVARFSALLAYGGVYMDTDVELLKPMDVLLSNRAFLGFETGTRVATSIIGSEKKFELFFEFFNKYKNLKFQMENGTYNLQTNVTALTNHLKMRGLLLNNKEQTIGDCTIYPIDFFCAKDFITKSINVTENTYTIHHFDSSWYGPEEKFKLKTANCLSKYFPNIVAWYLTVFFSLLKFHGIKIAVSKMVKRLFK